MAISEKCGKIYIQKIGSNEPVFILRARDRLAEETLKVYRFLAVSHEPSLKNILDKVVTRVRNRKGPKKIPD